MNKSAIQYFRIDTTYIDYSSKIHYLVPVFNYYFKQTPKIQLKF